MSKWHRSWFVSLALALAVSLGIHPAAASAVDIGETADSSGGGLESPTPAAVEPSEEPSPTASASAAPDAPAMESESDAAEITADPSSSSSATSVLEAPEIASVNADASTITFTWDWGTPAQSWDEATEIVVHLEPGGISQSVVVNSTTTTVSGLTPGTEYTVVIAVNDGEQSVTRSQPVTVTTLDGTRLKPQARPGDISRIIVETASEPDSVGITSSAASDLPVAGVAVGDVQDIGNGSAVVELSQGVSEADALAILKDLEADPRVASVELDQRVTRHAFPETPPDDTYWTSGDLWGLFGSYGIGIASGESSMNNVWTSNQGSGAVVAVLDTGYTTHPDLNANYVSGYDFVSSGTADTTGLFGRAGATNADGDYVSTATYGALGWDDNPLDPGDWNNTYTSSWHGTHVAGTVAAVADNSAGVVGVAPEASIQPVRVLTYGGGWTSDIAAAITWASGGSVTGVPANATPADVINLSLGGQASCTSTWQTAIDAAVARGSVVVVSAGNSDIDAVNFVPANCNNVITVAATTRAGIRSSFSNYGSTVEIAAPGTGIWSTVNSGTTLPDSADYASYNGTSMAAPHVSGVAALLKSADGTRTPSTILSMLQAAAQSFPTTGDPDDCTTSVCGSGLLSASPAVETAPSIASLVPTSGSSVGGDSVTISGYNFTGATAVTFDGVAATSFTVDSDTTITAVTPAHAAGAVDVVVTQGGQTATAVGGFTYVAPSGSGGCGAVDLTSISSTTGTTAGGETLTLTGTGLCNTTNVLFGSAAATVSANTDTSITVTTPASAAGTVNVTVVTTQGTDSLSNIYTYVAPPTTPVVDSVTSGDHILFITMSTGTTADSLTYRVFGQSSGGSAVSSMTFVNVVSTQTESYFFDYSGSGMTSGQTYYLELEACNASAACTTTTRFPFAYTTSADGGAPTASLDVVQPFDNGIQVAGSMGAGDFESIVTTVFTSSSTWAPLTWAPTAVRPSVTSALYFSGSHLANGTTYYVSSIIRTSTGFSAWLPREAVTPVATPPPPIGYIYFSVPSIVGSGYSLPVNWFEPYTVTSPIAPWSGTVTGYQVEYSTDGTTWSTAVADTGHNGTFAVISGLAPGTYYFRVSAISAAGVGASRVSGAVTLPRISQTVAWSPSNTAITGSSGTITPSASATTSGDGAITYAVASAGSTGCTVDASSGEITYTAPGSCRVTATAAQTATFATASTSVTFVITAPAASAPPAGGGSSGGGSSSESPGGGGALQTITELRPASGPIGGGNTVAIIGYGFTGATSVTIGGRAASFEVINDAHVDVVIPPGAALGSADVAVNLTPERGRAFAPGGYVYVPGAQVEASPSVTVVNPEGQATSSTPSAEIPAMESVIVNPVEPRQLPRGVTVLGAQEATDAVTKVIRKPAASKIRKAPRVSFGTGDTRLFTVRGLPEDSRVKVQLRIKKKYYTLGWATTTADGEVVLPAFAMSRKGNYVLRFRGPEVGKSYVRLRVK